MEDKLYTAGEIARIAGVSLRTIRFYDVKGLLKPVSYSDAGYRYYDQGSLLVLQRILMLKYLGFSLQEIEEMLKVKGDIDTHLAEQKELLIRRKAHLEKMIGAIENLEKSTGEDKWNYLIRLLKLVTEDERIKEQYKNAGNLEKRINIHAYYSTSKQDWVSWVYERLNLKPKQTVLEIGCGNGQLWSKNAYRLPEGLHIVLTDRSEGMLEQTGKNLSPFAELFQEKNISVTYQCMDANELQLMKGSFDVIIANHMLYHVEKREECLQEIANALKNAGTFFCSTVGEGHMREMHDIVSEFDPRIEMPFDKITVGFNLENGKQQLGRFFAGVERQDMDNDLIVDDAEAIYDYVYSYPGNAPLILDQRGEKFKKLLKERIEKEGAIYIHKSTGMFICNKA